MLKNYTIRSFFSLMSPNAAFCSANEMEKMLRRSRRVLVFLQTIALLYVACKPNSLAIINNVFATTCYKYQN